MDYKHVSVMLNEVLEYLDPKSGQNYIDCTLGGAGYTEAIAKRISPDGSILAIDLDTMALKNAKKKLSEAGLDNFVLVHNNFRNVGEVVEENWPEMKGKIDGIVYDIGLSSAQFDDRERGFSFQFNTPLNMQFGSIDGTENDTEDIVNNWKEEKIFRILKDYGEEQFAKSISSGIVSARKEKEIKTTGELLSIIRTSVPGFYRNNKKLNCATKSFQALRIATNNELQNIEESLPQALELLKPGGKIVVISFHSLEDRIVKHFFKDRARGCICPPEIPICRCEHEPELKVITKKVLLPSQEEIDVNPRARSAKMRVAEKI